MRSRKFGAAGAYRRYIWPALSDTVLFTAEWIQWYSVPGNVLSLSLAFMNYKIDRKQVEPTDSMSSSAFLTLFSGFTASG